jgi:dihydropyrimidinase
LGVYPKKGIIAPGNDADMVIVDPDVEKTLKPKDLPMADYSIHEGIPVKGYPIATILRGNVIVENGEFKGKAGERQSLRRLKEVKKKPPRLK